MEQERTAHDGFSPAPFFVRRSDCFFVAEELYFFLLWNL